MPSMNVNNRLNQIITSEINKKPDNIKNADSEIKELLFRKPIKSEANNTKKIGLFDHKNFLSKLFYNLARVLSLGLKESRTPQIFRQLSDSCEQLNKLISSQNDIKEASKNKCSFYVSMLHYWDGNKRSV